MENNQNVFVRMFQCKTQTSFIDESVDSTSKVFCLCETLRHQQSILPRSDGDTHLHLVFAEDRQKNDPSVKSMCGTRDASHIWLLGINVFVSSKDECFRCGKQTQCRTVLQSKSRC